MKIGLKNFSYIHRNKRFQFESSSRVGWELIYKKPEYKIKDLIENYGNNIKEDYRRIITDLYLNRSSRSFGGWKRGDSKFMRNSYVVFVCDKIL